MPAVNIHQTYMKIAEVYSKMSYAKRKKVGALLVRNGRVISTGYNGMPKGLSNDCEETLFLPIDGDHRNHDVGNQYTEERTKSEVVHAEMNAILFAARHGSSTENCILYVTMSPCVECSKAIIQAGIDRVYYKENYRETNGLKLLENAGIIHKKI